MLRSNTNDIKVSSKVNITEFFDPEKVSLLFLHDRFKYSDRLIPANHWCWLITLRKLAKRYRKKINFLLHIYTLSIRVV